MWCGLNLSKCLSRFFWALVCVCWGLVVQGEFGMAQQRDFATWLQEFRAEAVALGIRPQTLDAALTGLRPLLRVIELDRKQPEDTLTYAQYLSVPCQRRTCAKRLRLLNEHRALLRRLGRNTRAARHHRGALGDETDFGRATGNFSVLASLATLAYDGRRSALFVVNCWRRSKSSMPAMCVLRP